LIALWKASTNPRTTKFEFDQMCGRFLLRIDTLPSDRHAPYIFEEEQRHLVDSIDQMESSGGREKLPGAALNGMRTIALPVGTIVSMTTELTILRWWQKEQDLLSTSSVVRVESETPRDPL
jgi:hypothetical protein